LGTVEQQEFVSVRYFLLQQEFCPSDRFILVASWNRVSFPERKAVVWSVHQSWNTQTPLSPVPVSAHAFLVTSFTVTWC